MTKQTFMLGLFGVAILLAACSKMDSNYKDYLKDGEIVYPGTPVGLRAIGGKNKIILRFKPATDPNVVAYRVYWNNGADSLSAKASGTGDSVSVRLTDLAENTYNFEVRSFDAQNRPSVKAFVSGKVYGEAYQKSIFARSIKSFGANLNGTNLVLGNVDPGSVQSTVEYTDVNGAQLSVKTDNQTSEVLLAGHQPGSPLKITTSFLPEPGSPDTFFVSKADIRLNPFVGLYQATGVFHHPVNGDRPIDEEKALTEVSPGVLECNLGDLGGSGFKMRIVVKADNTVALSPAGATPNIDQHWGSNYYDPATRTFHLHYSYNTAAPRIVEETIKLK